MDIKSIDAIIVTHAHLDHIGKIPLLVKKGFQGEIYMTKTTFDLSKLNWLDSVKISEEESKKAKHLKRKLRNFLTIKKLSEKLKNNYLKQYEKDKLNEQLDNLLEHYNITVQTVLNNLEKYGIQKESDLNSFRQSNQIYTIEDVYATIKSVEIIDYHTLINLHEQVSFKFYNAAHIEGSAMPCIIFKNERGKQYRCLIAQDLGRFHNNTLEENITYPNKKIHYLQLENTYAGRDHPELKESIDKLINEIKVHKGPILLPAFAIQRTQYILKILLENFNKFNRKIYLTSELANQVKDVFLTNNYEKYKYLLDKRLKFLGKNDTLSEKKLNEAIIIGSSGMLQGGSILRWLPVLVNRKDTKIIFVGYQGAGTRGREILDGKDFIIVDGKSIPVKCQTAYITGFSSHADTKDLMFFLGKFNKTNKKIYLALTHGGNNRYILKDLIKKTKKLRKKYDVHIPKLNDKIEIFW